MKKLVLALAIGAMIMGFASMAAAEVTVGGSAEIRYDLWKNLDLNTGASNSQTTNFFDERVMVNVDAKIAEGLEGFVEFDTDNQNWGQTTSPFNIPTYLNHEFGSSAGGVHGNVVDVRQAWINAMVPGIPVGVKIGHQPLALGHGIWLDTHRYGSDAILVYSKPTPALLIAAAYVQMSQNGPTNLTNMNNSAFGRITPGIPGIIPTVDLSKDTTAAHSGVNAYAALANFTWMENNTIGFNGTYVRDNGSLSPIFGDDHRIWATNAAIVADGTIAALSYRGELDWLHVDTENVFGTKSYIVNGYAGMLGADMKLMNVATVGAEVAYGSGNSSNEPQIFYNPGATTTGGSRQQDHAYYTPYNNTSYNYAFLYNDKIGQGPLGSGGGYGFGDGYGGFGLANTGYAKISAGFTPTDKLKIGVSGLYLWASEAMLPGQSRDLGWEVDGNVGYKLYENLSLDLTGGVFDPGAWYAFKGIQNTAAGSLITNPDILKSDGTLKRNVAWGAETKLTMKF
ncbi:MAG: hypothetical protein WA666_07085 [Nitrospirota bacterium]